MINVMIVDDEYIVREDLHTLIDWEKQGFHIVAEAENGQRGIEMFEKFHPQLILTDIKMPVMNGLDMANIIMEKAPQTQFILLTAYGEFDYARRAMEKGICAYLLKHEIEEGSLLLELRKAESVIRKRDYSKKEKRENYLREKLTGNGSVDSAEEEESLAMLKSGRSYLAVLALQRDFPETPGLAAYEEFETAVRMQLKLKENDYFVRLREEEYVFLLDLSELTGYRVLTDRTEAIGKTCRDLASEHLGMKCFLSFSRQYEDRLYSLLNWYEETKHVQKYRYFEKGKNIFYVWDYTCNKVDETRSRQYHEYRKELRKALQEQNADKINEMIQKMMQDIKNQPDLKLWDRTVDFLELSLCNEKMSAENRSEESLEKIKEEVLKLSSVDEVALYFQNKFRNLFDKERAEYSPRIEKALDYIKEHYDENITLKEMAVLMEVSEIYASQLFKKVMGVSFMRYLTEYRMKIAKNLILQGYKVYEASEMVGYQTVQYFTTMFKKYEGCTPKEYYSKMEKKT